MYCRCELLCQHLLVWAAIWGLFPLRLLLPLFVLSPAYHLLFWPWHPSSFVLLFFPHPPVLFLPSLTVGRTCPFLPVPPLSSFMHYFFRTEDIQAMNFTTIWRRWTQINLFQFKTTVNLTVHRNSFSLTGLESFHNNVCTFAARSVPARSSRFSASQGRRYPPQHYHVDSQTSGGPWSRS